MARAVFNTPTHAVPVIRLLLVEDGMSDAYLVESLLDEIGGTRYEIAHVRTQNDAVNKLDDQQFDACLLDLKLPGTNEFGALIDIQQKAPSMPVLILTGHNDTALARRAVGRGAQDYLFKDDLERNTLRRSIDHAIERKRMEEILFMRANHDSLTGLANRSMFESRTDMALARADRAGSAVAVLFIDLDKFKQINDTYGHEAGDEILKTVAARLKTALRPYDTCARLGGDEFAVLLEGMANPRDAAIIAQKVLQSILQPINYHGRELDIGISIGIAFSHTQTVTATLLQQADTAMYYAKKEGSNITRFYAPAMQTMTETRLKLEDDMRTALDSGELKLLYQPYIMPGGESIVGVEALLRWENPERGTVLPNEFLPVAEAGKLMPDIGVWTGQQIVRDLAMWNSLDIPPLEIAINLSASQMDDSTLTDWLFDLCHKEVLGHHRLAVEISEMDLIHLSDSRIKTLGKLCTLGIALHLDHFGSGALSLKTLHTLPFSLLKIDVSHVHSMNDKVTGDAIINAAILLAHHLGIKAGAAGVETHWQLQTLINNKCDSLQGYLTAPPMSSDEVVEWLENRQALNWQQKHSSA